MVDQIDYVELELACPEACAALNQGPSRKELNDLDDTVCEAIEQPRM